MTKNIDESSEFGRFGLPEEGADTTRVIKVADEQALSTGHDCLVCIYGGPVGRRFELDGGATTIGRGDDCGITLGDEKTSRVHLQISFDKGSGQHIAEDMKSTNGSWCNGKAMNSPVPLEHGAEIELGQTVLEYSSRTFPNNEAAQAARKRTKAQEAPETLLDDTNRPF